MEKKESTYKSSVYIFIICFVVYASCYIARGTYSNVVEIMKTNNIIDTHIAGLISSVYFICYAVGQLLNGILADRKSPFILVLIGLILIFGSLFLMATFYNPSFLLVIWWGINGIGQSMLWSPIFFIMTNVLNPDTRARAIKYFSLTGPVGRILSYLFSGIFSYLFGWKGTFYMVGTVVFAVALLWISGYLYNKKDLIFPEKRVEKKKSDYKLIPLLIKSGVIIAIPTVIIHGLFLNGAVEWIPSILIKNYDLAPSISSFISIFIPIVGVCGVFLCHYTYEKICKKNEMKNNFLYMVLTIVPLLLMLVLSLNVGEINLLFEAIIFAILFALTYLLQLGFNHTMMALVPYRFVGFALAGTMSGLLNAVNYGGSAISTYAMAVIIEEMSFSNVIIFWICLLIVAIVFLALSLRRYNRFIKKLS